MLAQRSAAADGAARSRASSGCSPAWCRRPSTRSARSSSASATCGPASSRACIGVGIAVGLRHRRHRLARARSTSACCASASSACCCCARRHPPRESLRASPGPASASRAMARLLGSLPVMLCSAPSRAVRRAAAGLHAVAPPKDKKGRMIAVMNQANWIGMLISPALLALPTDRSSGWPRCDVPVHRGADAADRAVLPSEERSSWPTITGDRRPIDRIERIRGCIGICIRVVNCRSTSAATAASASNLSSSTATVAVLAPDRPSRPSRPADAASISRLSHARSSHIMSAR